MTCSGGTASLDMMLHLIAQAHGNALAATVSEQFIHDRIRDHMIASGWSCAHASGSAIRSCWLSWPKWSRISKTRCRKQKLPVGQHCRHASSNVIPEISQHHANRYYLNLRIARAASYCARQACPYFLLPLPAALFQHRISPNAIAKLTAAHHVPNGPWINLQAKPRGGSL